MATNRLAPPLSTDTNTMAPARRERRSWPPWVDPRRISAVKVKSSEQPDDDELERPPTRWRASPPTRKFERALRINKQKEALK